MILTQRATPTWGHQSPSHQREPLVKSPEPDTQGKGPWGPSPISPGWSFPGSPSRGHLPCPFTVLRTVVTKGWGLIPL